MSLLFVWHGNNPDLNPIEVFWAWAQVNADVVGCIFLKNSKTVMNPP
jgi:hypothetical protein